MTDNELYCSVNHNFREGYEKGRADAEELLNEIHLCECNQIRAEAENRMQRILDDEKRLSYEQGRADGYSQAENDYHKQTEKDRQISYYCGYEQGIVDICDNLTEAEKQIRADAIDEFAKLIHEDLYQLNHHQVDFLAKQLKEQMSDGTNDNKS